MWKSRNLLISAAAAACALAVAPATAQATPAPATSGHGITAAAQARPATYGWIVEGIYPTESECELIGLDYFEDGYAADYECLPTEGSCPTRYVLWLYVPEAESGTSPAVEHSSTTAAVQPAC